MKSFFNLIIMLLLISCSNRNSDCIDTMMDEFIENNRNSTFIYEFKQDGSQFYIFDGGIAFDAIATVVNEDCMTVCTYGGLRANNPNPCTLYQESINNARQIWPN